MLTDVAMQLQVHVYVAGHVNIECSIIVYVIVMCYVCVCCAGMCDICRDMLCMHMCNVYCYILLQVVCCVVVHCNVPCCIVLWCVAVYAFDIVM